MAKRYCVEVRGVGAGTMEDPLLPDIPRGLQWGTTSVTPTRKKFCIVISSRVESSVPNADWTGTEAEAILRWGVPSELRASANELWAIRNERTKKDRYGNRLAVSL